SKTLIELENEIPSGLIPLLNVPGLGGKKLSKIYHELGVTDAESLQQALENKKVEKLPGFGKKSAENILNALKNKGERPERLPISVMLHVAERMAEFLGTISEIRRFSRAGSLRRMRETIKDIDFRLVAEKEFASTLHHFTGSKDHNVRMRQLAKKQGEKINEYGVEVEETGEILTFTTEEAFFKHFGLNYIPPEVREDRGEVDA